MTRSVHMVALAEIGELSADQYVGLIDDSAIACLSVRLAIEGLHTPIWLRRNGNAAGKPFSVIAGRHRLRAAAQLGWTEIAAEQRADAGTGPDDIRRLQVAENLDRRVLRPIERACHIMERWREEAATIAPSAASSQQAAAIRSRWSVSEATSHLPVGDIRAIDEATAKACGVTDRTIRDYRKLHTKIVIGLPSFFARLNAHPLGESVAAMTRLASLNENARPKAAEMILSRLDWNSIVDALVAADCAKSPGNRVDQTQPHEVFLNAWAGMSPPRRLASLCELARDVTPSLAEEFVSILRAEGKIA